MKKSIIALFIGLFSIVNVIHAQSLEDVLKKHFDAVGQEKLVKVKSFVVKANVSQMGMEMPMFMQVKKPNMFRMEIDMQGQKMIQAFDGEKGWMIAPWISAEPQELAGEQLKQAMDQADMEGELYNYEKKGSTVEFVGKVNLDGKAAYRLKLTDNQGNIKDYFIDADNYRVVKVKAKVEAMGQTAEVEQRMLDFQTINGITMAMKIETDSPMGTAVITMEEVKFDEDLDNSIFQQPAK